MSGVLVIAYLIGVWTWFEMGGPGNYATRAVLALLWPVAVPFAVWRKFSKAKGGEQ